MIQDSPEWHEWRGIGIGGSEVATAAVATPFAKRIAELIGVDDIMELSPYSTPHELWSVKTKRSKGFEGNSFTEHGKELEAKARARYEYLVMEDAPPMCATHPKFKRCIVSLDGFRKTVRRVVEFKCPKGKAVIEAALRKEVVPYYVPQVQYQMAVSGADGLDFFVFHEEMNIDALVEVQPNLELQGLLIAAVNYFWDHYIAPDTPPPLTDRDFLDLAGDESLAILCRFLEVNNDKMQKKDLDEMKANIIERAGHPKIKCGTVKISTVLRKGIFSYHKLTIRTEPNDAA